MRRDHVLIAGGGIGGLVLALTLHEIGVPCTVFEGVRELKPLGVGINLQPNAVRELEDLGIGEAEMDAVGIPAREWALVGQLRTETSRQRIAESLYVSLNTIKSQTATLYRKLDVTNRDDALRRVGELGLI